ncbi:MAG: alpha/beta hydrolase family protein [Gaiella sp.]
MTPAELTALLEELERWSAERTGTVEQVAYGLHPDQVLDLRLPAGAGPHPLALVLHGGFWRPPYTRSGTAALAVALVEQGWATANAEYRRLGPGAYRPMLDDVAAAGDALPGFAATVAVGHSAGGHLALWLAAQGRVDAVVALGGVCDLRAAAAAGLGTGAVAELLGGLPGERAAAYREADPAAHLPLGRPQVLVHGTHDDRVPIEHARAYAERSRAAGDDCRLVEVDAGHFEPIDPRSAVWPTLCEVLATLPLAGERSSSRVPAQGAT